MLQSIEARTGQPVGDAWPESSLADIHRAAHTAAAVAGNFAASSAAERASLLRALAAMRLRPKSTVVCNSMIALAELASAGLGVAYLPREYFSAYIRSNELCAVQTNLALPPLEYVAVHANNAISRHIAELARQQCHFGRWRRNGLGVPR